jgi:hypothetical protein
MSNDIRVGETIGNDTTPTPWKIVDEITKESVCVAGKPTKDDINKFKKKLGYSAVKPTTIDSVRQVVVIRSVDKAGDIAVGEVIGDDDIITADDEWHIVDAITKTRYRTTAKPDKNDIRTFFKQLGYSSVMILSTDYTRQEVTIRTVDKAGLIF